MFSGGEDFYIKTGSMQQHLFKSRAHKEWCYISFLNYTLHAYLISKSS